MIGEDRVQSSTVHRSTTPQKREPLPASFLSLTVANRLFLERAYILFHFSPQSPTNTNRKPEDPTGGTIYHGSARTGCNVLRFGLCSPKERTPSRDGAAGGDSSTQNSRRSPRDRPLPQAPHAPPPTVPAPIITSVRRPRKLPSPPVPPHAIDGQLWASFETSTLSPPSPGAVAHCTAYCSSSVTESNPSFSLARRR